MGDQGLTGSRRAWAPGRVNLIGDHTDYNGGLVLPIAIDLGTEVLFRPTPGSPLLSAVSDKDRHPVRLDLDAIGTGRVPIGAIEPPWGRFVAAVAAAAGRTSGGALTVRSTLPVGAGLSSSASLCVGLTLALGDPPLGRAAGPVRSPLRGPAGGPAGPVALAHSAREAEREATGVSTGIMDQLCVAAARAGHALLIDCATESLQHVPVPGDCEVVVIHSGVSRSLATSPYGQRRAECDAAAQRIGSLATAGLGALDEIGDPLLRRRARHVITENRRVAEFAQAMAVGDLASAGRLMTESHRSLRDDFEVSTPVLDGLVDELIALPGIFGARLTGAGFGGCVVALGTPHALDVRQWPKRAWRVQASGGATVSDAGL